ncbi:hypothetical protein K474DRAFT_1680916 [Panus rudis PR-1116 ss-1]|nr:hypothetical protein K474DRAFT_1680916 [Panus rudis PR-1116 ss-1]
MSLLPFVCCLLQPVALCCMRFVAVSAFNSSLDVVLGRVEFNQTALPDSVIHQPHRPSRMSMKMPALAKRPKCNHDGTSSALGYCRIFVDFLVNQMVIDNRASRGKKASLQFIAATAA